MLSAEDTSKIKEWAKQFLHNSKQIKSSKDIYDIMMDYSSWSGGDDVMLDVAGQCAEELKNNGYSKEDLEKLVQETGGIYGEDQEGNWDRGFVDAILKNLSQSKQIKSDITDADITVIRQGPKTKILDETPFEHIKKNLDAYLGNSPEDMWYLVVKPSGYELAGAGETPDGVNTVWFKKKGAKEFALVFDADNELIDVKGAPARVFDSKKSS